MQKKLCFLKIWRGSLSATSNSCNKLLSLRSYAGELAALRKGQIPSNAWVLQPNYITFYVAYPRIFTVNFIMITYLVQKRN